MRNWVIGKLFTAMIVITTTGRVILAGILLWAFEESDSPLLRIALWSVGMGMIVYAFWRVYKLNQFLKFDKNLGGKE